MANPGPASTTTIHPQNVASNQAIRLLASATGVNVNATGDQAVMQIINSTSYSVSNVVFTDASTSLTTAAAGVFTAPSAGGTAIVANAALSALTGPKAFFKDAKKPIGKFPFGKCIWAFCYFVKENLRICRIFL